MDGAKAAVNDTAQTPRNTTVAVSSDGHNQDVDEDRVYECRPKPLSPQHLNS